MEKYIKEAQTVADAILTLAEHPSRLDNFKSYLSYHFDTWLEKYADCPLRMASEMKTFSEIKCD